MNAPALRGALALCSALSLSSCSSTIEVTSSADSGVGSLRSALEAAASDSRVHRITLRTGLEPIALDSPLVYRGSQRLQLDGRGVVLDGSRLTDTTLSAGNAAFVADGGSDLGIRNLVVRGAAGSGIAVLVPASRSGRVTLELDQVVAERNGHHGIVVNDQAAYFSDPFTVASDGSEASITVRVRDSRFIGNGNGGLDYDGLRVNEGGPGSLEAVIRSTHAEGNGGDGVELDERDDGDAVIAIERTDLLANGFHSTKDLEDGFDVDEYGPGHLRGRLVEVTASRNAQKGVDLTEEGAGELRVTRDRVVAEGNPDDAR